MKLDDTGNDMVEYAPLRLREIIWEVTLKCDSNCKYCGSKAVKSEKNPSNLDLANIVSELVKYPPEVVVLSGGEPGCLDPMILGNIIKMLSDAGIKVRIVTNGRVLSYASSILNFDLLDRIGWSVNEAYSYAPDHIEGFEDKITVITNFGTHNIWNFDEIAKSVQRFGVKCWQVQLTMGDFMLPPDGIAHLRKKIKEYAKDLNIVVADNLQESHICGAGVSSCAITAHGEVIPCLSERSLSPACAVTSYGSLYEKSLKDIWEREFRDIRFGCGGWKNSCRNCVKYPLVEPVKKIVFPITMIDTVDDRDDEPWTYPRVTLYGVSDSDVVVYGVGGIRTWR